MTKIQQAIDKIVRGTTEIIGVDSLEKKLKESAKTGKPLRIKAGFDPTAPDIHLGHVVLLNKLRQFQDLGHQVFFLIGDFTAQVGDPSGRDQLRPKMSTDDVARNAKTYKQQVFKVLDKKKTTVVFNSHWLGKLTSQDMLELSAYSTVAQMLARADFKKRYEEGKEISLLEFIYPLLQGYDSVYLQADVELGGSDQKFNLLMGRQLQEGHDQEPQVVVMTPLLEGLDGVKKMSKTLNNTVGIEEPPDQVFGKIMSVSDELMMRYFEVLTEEDLESVRQMHPKEAKVKLAQEVTSKLHGAKAAQEAREGFEKVFSQKQTPEDMEEFAVKGCPDIVTVLVESGQVSSKKEARRLIQQGAVSCDGERVESEDWPLQKGILKIGKRRFLKLL